jgi:hypothetical protein
MGGLVASTEYSFIVYAVNGFGPSAPSTPTPIFKVRDLSDDCKVSFGKAKVAIAYFLCVLLALPLVLLLLRALQSCCCKKKVDRRGAYEEAGPEQEMAAMVTPHSAYQRGFDDELEDDDEL